MKSTITQRISVRPILAVLFLLTVHCSLITALAQTAARYEISGSGAPAGNCTVTGSGYSQIYVDRDTGKRWACVGALGVTNGVFFGWVSAADTVSIKFCAVVSGDPASGTFRADVWQH